MPKKITVIVTEEHIRTGERCDPQRCPVAWAIGEMFPLEDVYVDAHAQVGKDYYALPTDVSSWIMKYDRGLSMLPITFDMYRYGLD
jgi:hypothetical protein